MSHASQNPVTGNTFRNGSGIHAQLFLVGNACIGFAYFGIYSLLLNLYLLRLGYDAGFIGLISAIGQIVFALACIPVGRLGERFGLLSMMRGGIALTVLGGILVPLAGW